MGDPRKLKKKYSTPPHPWQATRIEEERKLKNRYGLKNKTEIWKSASFLRNIKKQAKTLIASTSEQGKKEGKQLLQKLQRLNLLSKEATIEDVLNLQIDNILDRRLQTQVFKQGFARTPDQARQFIVHGHISVLSHRVSIPSYMLTAEEEAQINFAHSSKLKNEDHPERKIEKKEEKSKIVKPLKKETEKAEPKKKPKEEKIKEAEKEIVKEETKK